jgi:hypothetical protein
MMKKLFIVFTLVILLTAGVAMPSSAETTEPTVNSTTSLTGQWYGTWSYYAFNYGSTFGMEIYQEYGYAVVDIPEAGLFHQPLPATFGAGTITIYASPYTFTGTVSGDSITGWIYYGPYLAGEWEVFREFEVPSPEPNPGTPCVDLPDLYTIGDVYYTAELLPFDPDFGPGYIDYPMNGETWENQYRSYSRRDLMQVVKYAAAKVECVTSEWDYWDFAPIGLIDMSEADGSIPGTSIGSPGHPPGTHMYGNDMDIAYYQLYTPDNNARIVGEHYDGYFEAHHLTDEPFALDPYRTALFISYLAEHHHVRVIGVDGQVGLVLEEALDELVALGYIDAEHRASIPLAYEVTNQGYGWFYFHHHHMHVSMNDLYLVGAEVDVKPDSLNRKSNGKYLTGYLELGYGLDVNYVDDLKLVVSGHNEVSAAKVEVTDFNNNGIADLTIKFDRSQVTEDIDTGEVEVALTGTIFEYYHFQETDTISVVK